MLKSVFSGRGLSFAQRKVKIKNSTGVVVAKGDLLQFDHLLLSAADTFKEGSELGAWFHCVNPGSSVRGYAYYCVTTKAMAVDEIAEAWIYHPSLMVNCDSAGQVRVGSGSGTTDTGRSLKFGAADVGAKAIAVPQGATVLGLTLVAFNGIEGFGVQKS